MAPDCLRWGPDPLQSGGARHLHTKMQIWCDWTEKAIWFAWSLWHYVKTHMSYDDLLLILVLSVMVGILLETFRPKR